MAVLTSLREFRLYGAGVEPHEVNELVKQYDGMASMMKEMAGMGVRDRMKKVQELQQSGGLGSNGQVSKSRKGTGKRLSPKEKAKLRKLKSKELRRKKREQKKSVSTNALMSSRSPGVNGAKRSSSPLGS